MRQLALVDKRRDRRALNGLVNEGREFGLVQSENDAIEAAGAEMAAQFRFALLDMAPLPADEGVGFFLDRFQHEQGVEVDLDAIPGDALGTVVTLLELERLWTTRKSGSRH
jgi:hypothetical protein